MEFIKDSVDCIIFAILGLMGFVTVWLTIERLLFLRSVQPSGYADKATTRPSPTTSRPFTSFIRTPPTSGFWGP